MKKYAFLIVLGLIGSLSFAQGDLHTTLPQIVSYPQNIQLNTNNNFALVEFSVDDNGIIEVKNINACEALKSYVIEKLDGYKLINPNGLSGQTFQYKLSFQQ